LNMVQIVPQMAVQKSGSTPGTDDTPQ
jgi:hypothetical protein